MGKKRAWLAFAVVPLAIGCGDGVTGRVDVASVVAPLYAGVEVRYKAVAEGESCDAHSEGEVSGPASLGGSGYFIGDDYGFARESLQLPVGPHGICATVFDAKGQVEARCPTTAVKVKVSVAAPATAYLGIVCDPVIDEKSGHAYTVTPLVDSFLDARKAAEEMGGHLVYIDDMDENVMLGRYFAPSKWIGLWDGNADRSFEWLDGVPRTFSSFCLGEPNAYAGEFYMEWVLRGSGNYCWNNIAAGPRQGIVEFE